MKHQDILSNQRQAIAILKDSLLSNNNKLLDFKRLPNTTSDLDLAQNQEEIIRENSKIINILAYQLSLKISDEPWFIDINAGKMRELGDGSVDFLLPNLCVSDDFLQLISLKNSIVFGTWGRHKVVLPPAQTIEPSSNTDRLLFIVHCNLHNTESRDMILTRTIHKYSKLLMSSGVKDIIIHRTNKIQTQEDIDFAYPKHPRHQHWSPATTIRFFQRVYAKFPRSIILTHPYIACLFLDNKLFFTFDSSLVVDNERSVMCSFSQILGYVNNGYG